MSEGAQCASAAGMERSVDAEVAVETALLPASSRMPQVHVIGIDEVSRRKGKSI